MKVDKLQTRITDDEGAVLRLELIQDADNEFLFELEIESDDGLFRLKKDQIGSLQNEIIRLAKDMKVRMRDRSHEN